MQEELRRASQALEDRTRELTRSLAVTRATLEATSDAILVSDQLAGALDFNDKYLALWGMPREVAQRGSASARQFTSRHFADPQKFLARVDEIVGGTEESFDVLETKDARIIERYSTILMVGDQKVGRVWSFRDITERRLAETDSQRLAAIVASSDDGIVGKDLRSIVTSWNAGAERIFGFSAEEMIGTSIMRLIPGDRRAEETEILSRIRRGERVDHFETVRVHKDGREIAVSITVSPIKDSTGVVVGASKVARDISRQKEVEVAVNEALEQAQIANRERLHLLESEREARSRAERASRMKDEFLATLSHELRTPLNAVLGWVNILQLEKCEGAELIQGLAVIERNARAQAQIIEDLLDMSRIISGKVRLDAQRVEISTVVQEAIDTVRATAEAKGVKLLNEGNAGAESFSGDPHRLQQVFWNLLSNAIKFTPSGGTVQLRMTRSGCHIEVAVTDTGEGISPDFLPYVFDRFQQADASTTRHHGGLGLGLAIVKQLVELHGGNVSVTSEGAGRGATFTVRFPLLGVATERSTEVASPTTRPSESHLLPAISLAGVHVLVVDDEPDARSFIQRLLAHAGATVSIAGSAAEALERMALKRPDILVCDIAMPEEDGYALIQKLRALEEQRGGGTMPAIALTA